jgi:hypothetical protein
MVALFGIKRLISDQRHEYGLQVSIERCPVLTFGLALVIAFEDRSPVNHPHAGLPSNRQRWRNAYPFRPQVLLWPCVLWR